MLKRSLKGRKNLVVVASIVLVSLGLMTLNIKRSQDPMFLETVLFWIISPIQSGFTHAVDSISDTIDHYVFLVEVSKENESLKKQVDQLARQNHQLEEDVRRLTRVGQLLEYRDNNQLNSIVATVIGRDATQWVKMVVIDRGTQDGVQENQAVVTDAGIVGHVIQAGVNSSKVLLIIDSRSAVDSLFKESRVSGVVVGTGTDHCDMKYVPITAEVKVGDEVIASGLGGIFPKGLMIGTVSKVTRASQGLFQDIDILPSADLSRLEEVLVLMSPPLPESP